MPVKKPSFDQTLKALRRGETLDELDAALEECISATELTGKTSSITVNLKIKPKGYGAFVIVDDVKFSKPKFDREATVLFANDEGHLVREDPRQQKLDLKPIDKGAKAELNQLPADPKPQLKTLS